MAAARQSNTDRKIARDECREALSKHIVNKLGLEVKPCDVRLVTSPDDPYRWTILPGHEDRLAGVFAKNLSSHSIGTYRLLCREVDRAFEAVGAGTQRHSSPSTTATPAPDLSFTAVIAQLQEENACLTQQAQDETVRADQEAEQRRRAEEEACQLRDQIRSLEQTIQRQEQQARHHRRFAERYIQALDSSLPALEDLRRQALDEIQDPNDASNTPTDTSARDETDLSWSYGGSDAQHAGRVSSMSPATTPSRPAAWLDQETARSGDMDRGEVEVDPMLY